MQHLNLVASHQDENSVSGFLSFHHY